MNARSEALIDGESGMWSTLKGKKRCVVPVNGYVSPLFLVVQLVLAAKAESPVALAVSSSG